MRRHNREISTLSLSMLDVIAGAMAAFLILMVILLPYYGKETVNQEALITELRQAVAQAEAARSAAQAQANQAQTEAERQQARAEGLARQLAHTFLVLYIRWDTHDDVDLHLTDPSGAEFWWDRHKIILGRPGELSEDNIVGPGNEVWEIRDAPPGDYRVEVRLFQVRDTRKPVVVKGRVFHRDGSEVFTEIALAQKGQRERIATIRVDEDGGVRLVP
ncbi:MAG: hypothetical protein IT487_01750 [Chromatiaceae bacterium]|nr:hypothetical protein [Chromatiaceae bacterium]